MAGKRSRPPVPTSMDLQRSKVGIRNKIEELNRQKEIVERSGKSVVDAVDALRQQKENLSSEIESLWAEVSELDDAAEATFKEQVKALKRADEIMSEFLTYIKELEAKVEEGHNELEIITTTKEAAMNEVQEAKAEIDRKQTDLDIYHARLKKAYEEHMPGKTIIL